ncbi:hypothetical protein SAMN04488018_12243 [Myroides marinus]|uniref:Uncharacterized protein n=1 Tax=Myroides marinus TaxID=703342 RepID=A0A1H6XKF5_9FLAO|nr:hypothetical protein [Myroides marinus]SEJ29568.1 hypothetical protein SAMN04488018_12243 [Myroides marinus]
MNKKLKIFLYSVLALVVYYIGSILIDPNGFFVQNQKINSVPKQEAIANKTFIKIVKPQCVYINNMKNDFYVYTYNYSYLESYGILQLLKHRVVIDQQCYYKFIITDSVVDLSEIEIQYNDLKTNLFNDVEGFNTMKSNNVMIVIKHKDILLYKALY